MSIEVMNAVWRESKATGRARLVLLAIADHQGEIGAWPSIATLARMVNASERSVQRDIAELTELGELKVEIQAAPSRGQYKSNLYWVKLPGVTDFESGVTESASGVTDSAFRGDTVVVQNLNINPNKKPNRTHGQETEKLFEQFWIAYPKKVAKIAARKAFLRAIGLESAEVIIAAAQRFGTDPNLPEQQQYIAHPTTWLNEGRWEDGPLPQRRLSVRESNKMVMDQWVQEEGK